MKKKHKTIKLPNDSSTKLTEFLSNFNSTNTSNKKTTTAFEGSEYRDRAENEAYN